MVNNQVITIESAENSLKTYTDYLMFFYRAPSPLMQADEIVEAVSKET
jgi:predicted oxidoreductase